MAKHKHMRKAHKKASIAILIPALAPAMGTIGSFGAGDYKAGTNGLVYGYSGINAQGQLDTGQLVRTYVPIAVGIAAHKVIGKHVNRYLPAWLPIGI